MKTAIAVALYNGEKFIIEQLESFRKQSRTADMVVFCDDGSKDNTVKIVEDYIVEHDLQDGWKVYRNEENLGYVRNFYKAITLCDAELVFLSDQDDIWEQDKIERMSAVMETHPEISLLCCQYGIIDDSGQQMHSIIEPTALEDGAVHQIGVEEIVRAYRWPGMAMCLRKEFFNRICKQIMSCKAAHDLVFAITAADKEAFFTIGYTGVYHRRHDNNAAREEHRVTKLLNRERKLKDIEVTRRQWKALLETEGLFCEKTRKQISNRLDKLILREEALTERSLKKIWTLYYKDKGETLRLKSFLCDVWLVCFAKNGKEEKGTRNGAVSQ